LFYLDYTYGSNVGYDSDASGTVDADEPRLYSAGGSIYNNPVGKGIQSGSTMTGGQYDLLGSGYSRWHDTTSAISITSVGLTDNAFVGVPNNATGVVTAGTATAVTSSTDLEANLFLNQAVDFDADVHAKLDLGILSGLTLLFVKTSVITGASNGWAADFSMLTEMGVHGVAGATAVPADVQPGSGLFNLRRFTKRVKFVANKIVIDPLGGTHIMFVINGASAAATSAKVTFAADSNRVSDSATGASTVIPTFESSFGSNEPGTAPIIPEIDIKIESLSVVATSRKLKAKWSPELAQDLNAYHSLDAEVELTQILSEQIALELIVRS